MMVAFRANVHHHYYSQNIPQHRLHYLVMYIDVENDDDPGLIIGLGVPLS